MHIQGRAQCTNRAVGEASEFTREFFYGQLDTYFCTYFDTTSTFVNVRLDYMSYTWGPPTGTCEN